jgi:type IV pilus assembly protein PilY1
VADFFYFSDLGGQVFRVDLHQTEVTSSAVRRVANLSGSGVANNRRFYYAPSISYVKSKDGTQEHLYISIGSGYRTHPLSENTNDYFYVIRDDSVQRSGGKWVGSAPASLVTPSSLATLTSSSAADATKPGWKLLLADDGEKALSEAVVFNNRVFFTSYAPTTQDGDDCVVRIGTAYLYVVDIITGYGVDPGNIGTIDTPRRKKLKQDIPPPSATMLSDGSELVVIIGTEVITGESLGNTGVRRGSWYQLQPGEPDKVPKP